MTCNSENAYGISEYISDHKGFFGIIKQRFSDFQVHEVASSGETIYLTSEEVIPVPSVSLPNKDLKRPPEIEDDEIELLKLISGQKHFGETKPSVFLEKSASGNDYKSEDITAKYTNELKIKVSELPKERRTEIHQFIKSEFPNLNSSTKEIGDEKFICVSKQESCRKKERRDSWPKSQSHVNFVLYKENIDTMEAINILAGKLRLKPGMFSYAGTKDRRGKTSQLVSVYQVSPQNLSSAAKSLPRVRVGNYFYSSKPQSLGQAKGNHFKVVLREVDDSSMVVDEAVKFLQEKGFINYFGMQRFSTSNVSTHTIGRALLQGNWKEAVDLILSVREKDLPDLAEAKKIWTEKKDAALAFRKLKPNRKTSIEGRLLHGLMEQGSKNLVNALEKIPRNTKLMYIHAYQSYLWNNVVSRRIKKYNLQVLPGDIKRNKKSRDYPNAKCEIEEEMDQSNSFVEEIDATESISNNIHFLTEKETSTVDVTEVLMPLPGYNIVYPENEIKDWYLEYLQKDNLSFNMFRNKVKTFSLGGAYRAIVVLPQSFKCSSCRYDDPTLPLIQSDLDALNGVDVTDNRLSDGAYEALVIEFALPTSAYATMALRELLKMDTSSRYQTSLNSRINNDNVESSLSTKRKCEAETATKKKKL